LVKDSVQTNGKINVWTLFKFGKTLCFALHQVVCKEQITCL